MLVVVSPFHVFYVFRSRCGRQPEVAGQAFRAPSSLSDVIARHQNPLYHSLILFVFPLFRLLALVPVVFIAAVTKKKKIEQPECDSTARGLC